MSLAVSGTNTSTSTVSENTGSNDQLAIGSGTSYVGSAGGNVQALNLSGSNLSGSVGADITNNINTEDPAVTGALTSAVDELGSTGRAAVEALGTNAGLAEYLAATSVPQNPTGATDTSSNSPTVAASKGISPVLIILAIAVVYIVAVK